MVHAGCDLDNEMDMGVRRADVFICCLTDHYLGRDNCMLEVHIDTTSTTTLLHRLL